MDSKEQASPFSQLIDMLDALQAAGISYRLRYSLPRAISVDVDLPDGRWELDYWEDGELYVEKFVSRSGVEGSEALAELQSDIAECLHERKGIG